MIRFKQVSLTAILGHYVGQSGQVVPRGQLYRCGIPTAAVSQSAHEAIACAQLGILLGAEAEGDIIPGRSPTVRFPI